MKKLALALVLLAACNRDPAERGTAPVSTTQPATDTATITAPAQPPAPAVTGPKLAFVDEGPRDPSFAAYRDQLLAAVRARDTKAVIALADPKIRTSFGGDRGSADLERLLVVANPDGFSILEQVLTNGGTFREGSFWAPYVYSAFPDEHDAFTMLAVTGDDIPLRASGDPNAPVLATLSRDIVERVSQPNHTGPWIEVKTADGKTGFVEAQYVRSPVDYRAGFNKGPNGWRMTALVAGD